MKPRLLLCVLLASLPGCSGSESEGDSSRRAAASDEAPQASPLDVAEDDRRRLESLGYVNLVPVDERGDTRSGVTQHDPAAAWPGFNLFNARHESSARLMRMDGEVVHRWASDAKGAAYRRFRDAFPAQMPEYLEGWNHVELLEGGDLLVIGQHHLLLRLDWDSNVRWRRDLPVHHDVAVAEDGEIYVLADALRSVVSGGVPVHFLDAQVLVLGPDGETRRSFSLFDAFDAEAGRPDEARSGIERGELQRRLAAIPAAQRRRLQELRRKSASGDERDRAFTQLYADAIEGELSAEPEIKSILFIGRAEDLFHVNSVQVLPRDEPGLWRAGDLLLSVLKWDSVVVLDHETGRIVWSWGPGELQRPHHATWQDDGRVLLFDNGVRRRYSRILEVDPRRREIVWSYQGVPPESFFSEIRGGVEPLANGNVLIAETQKGHAFEVTPDGRIVWEYWSEVAPGKQQRGAIYRMARIDPAAIAGRLAARP